MKYLLPLLFLAGCETFPEPQKYPEIMLAPIEDYRGEKDYKVADDDGRIHTVPIICGTGVVQGECGVLTCECICHY